MNEILFFTHVLVVLGFVLAAVWLGREALIVWTVLQGVFANFFVLKQMVFFGFHVTCSDVFAIGCIASLNLLQEYHNKESARLAIWISFFALLFYALMSQFHLLYIPSPGDTSHGAFTQLLSVAPRLLLASLITFFLIQQLDIRLFAFLKNRLPSSSFGFRSGVSLVITQFLDTVLFTFLGLYGLGFATFDIIVVSFLLKLLIIGCTLPMNIAIRQVKA